MDSSSLSLGLAFLAGLVSFLSPCVLPIVPGYVSFVTGLTLDEFEGADGAAARKQAALHSALFVFGFSLVFIGLGASATALGGLLFDALPLLQRVGGVVLVAFGLALLGLLRLPALQRERRVHLASKPAGKVGSVVTGIAFGAGWTPCIGPVLASILLYAGMEATLGRGMLLLGTYALGLGIPFFAAAVGVNWFIAGLPGLKRWVVPLERAAGAFLVVVGIFLLTGKFAALSGFFARYGLLINLEM